MKRGAIIGGVFLVAIAAIFGSSALSQKQQPAVSRDYRDMPEIGSAGVRTFYPLQLSEEEDASELIVQGRLHNDAYEHLDARGGGGSATFVVHGCTISSLEITKVHKGDIQIGDTIPLMEPFYIQSDNGIDSIVHLEYYMPSIPGEEYLFFLGRTDGSGHRMSNDVYYTRSFELGRYPVLSPQQRSTFDLESVPNRQLDISEREGGHYKMMYQEAIEKYMSD